jgi:thiol-disulfide isomerase/thioredoxin
MNRRQFITGIGATLLLPKTALALNEPFPEFQVLDEDRTLINLKTMYSGRKTLINVWEIYCHPCIQEIPLLNDMNRRINVIGLCYVSSKTPPDFQRELEFIKQIHTKIQYQKALIINYEPLFTLYKQQHPSKTYFGFPTFFLLDSKSNCTFSTAGQLIDNYERPTQNLRNLESAISKTN